MEIMEIIQSIIIIICLIINIINLHLIIERNKVLKNWKVIVDIDEDELKEKITEIMQKFDEEN